MGTMGTKTTKTFARYTTFKEGELEATLHGLDPTGQNRCFGAGRSKTGLIKSHNCTVTYPDATTGACSYLRAGPNWHVFRFEHTSTRSGKTAMLPVQNETERIGNTLAIIEETAQRLASDAFVEAAERENRDYFRRVLPPPPYKMAQGDRSAGECSAEALTENPQMKAKAAKQAAGRYALCIRVGKSLLPTGNSWETLAEAVEAWKSGSDLSHVIGCCCRFKRRWEEPSYNPLHGDSRYPRPPLPLPCTDQKPAQETATPWPQVQGIQVTQPVTPLVVPQVTLVTKAAASRWVAVGETVPAHGENDAPPEDMEDDECCDCDEYDDEEFPDELWEGDDE